MRRKNKRSLVDPKDLKPFSQQWYEAHSDRDRNWFEGVSGSLFYLFIAFVGGLLIPQSDRGYYRVHGALLLGCILISLLLFVRRSDVAELVRNAQRVMIRKEFSDLGSIGDALYVISMIVVLASLLFVVDYSFISKGGMRIGAVSALAIINAIHSITRAARKRKK